MTEVEKRCECIKASVQMFNLRAHYWMTMALYRKNDTWLSEEDLNKAENFIALAEDSTEVYKALVSSL